jgi:hypothetical protein
VGNGNAYSGSGGLVGLKAKKREEDLDFVSDRNKEKRLERIAEIEDKVFDISNQVVLAHLAFTEVEPDQQEPPEEWVQQFGYVAAKRRLIVAKAGYLRASEMPSAVKLAVMVRTSISRAYSQQHRGAGAMNQVNVKIALPAPTSVEHPGEEVYEIRDLDE